jgi:hypothetical protein
MFVILKRKQYASMAGNMPAYFKYFILQEKIPDDGNVRAKCTLCVSYENIA